MGKLKTAISDPSMAWWYVRNKSIPKVLNRCNRFIGKLVFGVDQPKGFSQQATGKIAVAKSQLRSRSVRSQSVEHDVEFLQQEEALELGQIYEDDLIDSIKKKFDERLSNGEHTYTRGHDGENYTYGVSSADIDYEEHFPEVQSLVDDRIKSILQEYYGSYFKPVRTNIWRNYHVPPEVVSDSEVFSNYWHFDSHTTDHMKLFIHLTVVFR